MWKRRENVVRELQVAKVVQRASVTEKSEERQRKLIDYGSIELSSGQLEVYCLMPLVNSGGI